MRLNIYENDWYSVCDRFMLGGGVVKSVDSRTVFHRINSQPYQNYHFSAQWFLSKLLDLSVSQLPRFQNGMIKPTLMDFGGGLGKIIYVLEQYSQCIKCSDDY